jgi:hypothetical protein
MKKILNLSILFSLIVGSLTAQNNSEKISCEIIGPKSGYFWVGIDNYLKITLKGLSLENIELKTEPEENIQKGKSAGEFIIKPLKMTDKPLKIFVINTINKEVLGNATFKYHRIPDPVATLNNLNSEKTKTKDELKSAKSLTVFISEDFQKDFTDPICNITSFEYQFTSKGSSEGGSVKGSNFDKKLLNLIKKCKKDDVISFNNITAKCQGDSASRKMASFSITIK